MKKLLMALGVTAVAGGCLGVSDQIINPYTETATEYALPITTEVDQGERVDIAKEKPSVAISGWNGEYTISIEPILPTATAERSLLSNEVKYDTGTITAFVKPKSENQFDFDLILEQKPTTNVFQYRVTGAEDFDFFYQPPLDAGIEKYKKYKNVVSCTETECVDAEGKVVMSRPEDVVGSYAVYSRTKRNHAEGETNYQTGKIGHIYRPKAIGANGETVWGILTYDNGILSVTVPPDFLESATYPVVVDPTYGYTSLGASEDVTEECDIYYYAGTFTGATGSTLTNGNWYGRKSSGSASATVWLGFYSTGSLGNKTRLDFVSSSLALTTTKTSYVISGGSYAGLTNGTAYYLQTSSNAGTTWRNEYDDTGTAASLTYHCNWNTTPPDPSGASDTDEPGLNWSFSYYWDYTEPGGGGGTPVYRNAEVQVQSPVRIQGPVRIN